MTTGLIRGLPRDPTIQVRTRRFLDKLARTVSDLILSETMTQDSDGHLSVNFENDNMILVNQVFGR